MGVTAAKLYVKQPWNLPGDLAAMTYDLVKFLTDDHASLTGPGWTVVACDDKTNIDTPSGGTSLANIDSGNDWSTGNANTPAVDSWICLESLDATTANGTNHFQLIIKSLVGEDIRFWLLPNENFNIPGSTTSGSDPTVPGDSLVVTVDTDADVNTAWLNMNADEGMMNFLLDEQSGGDARFFYVGEMDKSPTGWTRPYVMTVSVLAHLTGSMFTTLSPQDDVTICNNSRLIIVGCPETGGTRWMSKGTRKNLLGVDPIFPIGVATWTSSLSPSEMSGNIGFRGFLRNVRDVHKDVGVHGTLDSMDWVFANDNVGFPGIAIRWDGSTSYP